MRSFAAVSDACTEWKSVTSPCFRLDGVTLTPGLLVILIQGDKEKPFKYHKTVLTE